MGNKITKDEEIRLLKKRIRELERLEAGRKLAMSQRKSALEALRVSENQCKKIFNSIPASIMLVDKKGYIVDINPYHMKYISKGKTVKKDFIGTNILKRKSLVKAGLSDNFKKLLKGKSLNLNKVYFPVTTAGTDAYFNIRGVPVKKGREVTGAVIILEDITKREKADEKLRESQELYHNLFDNTGTATIIVQKDATITMANEECYEITGYSADELIGTKWIKYVAPKNLEQMLKYFKLRFETPGEVPNRYETCLVNKKGEARDTILSIGRIPNSELIIVSMIDITERKKTEEMLQRNEEKLRSIVEHSTNLFYSHTHEHVLTYLSPQCKDILGYEPEEAMVKWTDLITDNPINAKGFEYTQKAIDTGKRQPLYELEIRHKDGHNVWAEVREAPIVKNGKTVAIVGSLTNITEQKKVQEQIDEMLRVLQQNEERLSLALEGTGLGTWDHNYTTGEIVRNERWAEMLGYKFKELKPYLNFWESLIHTDDIEKVRELSRLCEIGKTDDFKAEYRMKAKNGEWKWILDWGKIVERDKKGKPLRAAGTHLDITERKIVEKTLEESETKFKLLTETIKDVFWMSTCGVGEIIYISPGYEILWERSRESLYKSPRSFLEAIHPDDLEIYLGVIDKYHMKGKPYECEYRIIRKDGKVRWIQERGYLVPHSLDKDLLMTGVCTDVTERKKAEEDNTLLAQTLKSAKDCISITDLKNNLIFVNEAFLETFGYTEKEILGKHISIVRSPHETIDLNKEIIPNTLKGGWHGELNNRRKDGTDFPIELWTSVVNDNMGKPIALVGISRNITERKRAEEEMEKLSTVVKHSSELINIANMDGRMTFLNSAGCEMLGIDPKKVTSTNIMEVIPGHLTDLVETELLPALKNSEIWEGDLQYLNLKTGELIDVHAMTFSINDPFTKKPLYLANVSLDITKRKQAEEAVKINEERLSLTLESAELGLWDQNMITGEVIRNERWAEMLGYKLSEIEPILKSWKDLVHPDDLKIVNLSIEEHESGKTKSYKVEHRMRAKNGEWKWILDWGRIVERDKEGKPLRTLGTHLDITEMKKDEEELRKYSENQAILVREINHRVRNNLTAIIGMLYAEEDLARVKGTEECLPILWKLETRIKGLATAHTMLSEGKWEPLKVTQLCTNVINATIKSQLSSKTVNIAITPSEIYVDSNQAHHLAMVINELATNSLKYAVQNKEKVNISINAGKDGEKIIIQFHDDGPGYPNEMLKGDFSKTSTGFELINGIVKKSLFGEVELSNDNGALTKIIFKNFEVKNNSES